MLEQKINLEREEESEEFKEFKKMAEAAKDLDQLLNNMSADGSFELKVSIPDMLVSIHAKIQLPGLGKGLALALQSMTYPMISQKMEYIE